jgi:hypothetical protein
MISKNRYKLQEVSDLLSWARNCQMAKYCQKTKHCLPFDQSHRSHRIKKEINFEA